MRALCRACLRPRLEHSKGRHYSYAPVRRTTFTPSRRKLSFCDAFAILLAPVLTTAFVLDATAKDRRRKEWDRQIADLQRQTDLLNQDQQERWLHVQRRSVRHGATSQRRMYSSQARAVRSDQDEDEIHDATQHLPSETNTYEPAYQPVRISPQEHAEDAESSSAPDKLTGIALNNARHSLQKFDQLLATRLALQLILHLRTGRAAVYQLISDDITYDLPFSINLDQLVRQLSAVNRSISRLGVQQYPYDFVHTEKYRSVRRVAAAELDAALESFQAGTINLPGLITTYATIVAEHRCGLPLDSYVKLHRKLHRFRHMALCAISESAIIDSHQLLDRHAIRSILSRCASTADAYRLQEFLTQIVKHDHHPRAHIPWVERRISGMRLSLPQNSDSNLIAHLVHATAHCQQIRLAEAYANYMLDNDSGKWISRRSMSLAFTSLLQHFSFIGDWISAQQWIDKFIHRLHRILDARDVLLRMLELCVSCERQQEYNLLLNIIVRFGITLPDIDNDKPVRLSPRIEDIRADWKRHLLEHEPQSTPRETLPFREDLKQELYSWQSPLRPDDTLANSGNAKQQVQTSHNRAICNEPAVPKSKATANLEATATAALLSEAVPAPDRQELRQPYLPEPASIDKRTDLSKDQSSPILVANKQFHARTLPTFQHGALFRQGFHTIGYSENASAGTTLIQRQYMSTARWPKVKLQAGEKENRTQSEVLCSETQDQESDTHAYVPLSKGEAFPKESEQSSQAFNMNMLSGYSSQLTGSVDVMFRHEDYTPDASVDRPLQHPSNITQTDVTRLKSFLSSTGSYLERDLDGPGLKSQQLFRFVTARYSPRPDKQPMMHAIKHARRLPHRLDRLASIHHIDQVVVRVRRLAPADQETWAARSRRRAGFGSPGTGIRRHWKGGLRSLRYVKVKPHLLRFVKSESFGNQPSPT